MAGFIPENVLDDILSRVDIVEVISAYIPLKRVGRNFKTNCPFHHEKTPSFMVSAERQIYHCFGCGESGNAFKFLMQYERLDFPEAVQVLARKAGVILSAQQKQDHKGEGIINQLFKINELAAAFYENNLISQEGKQATEYLFKRGIKKETIKLFKLGIATVKWEDLLTYLRAKSVSLSLIEKAGLILAKEGGGYYDRFRNRVIFPITDIKSRVIGFGARVFDATLPKYINSPETSIYTKGKNLYGLGFAKDSIRENDCVVIVEGYFDSIIPYQEGLKNIVASLGTALTVEQARLLKRHTHNVVMVYDSDNAGELATLRTLDIFIEEGMNVKVATLPKGHDPDSFVREKGVESFKEKIQSAMNLFDYKLGVLKSRYNFKEIEGKAKISLLMLETIDKFKNSILKSEYIKRLAQDLNISEEALMQEAKKIKAVRPFANLKDVQLKKTANINPTESLLIKLMLEERNLISRIRQDLEPADFRDSRSSKIVSILFDLVSQGKDIEPNLLMNHLKDEDMSQIVCESMFLPEISSQDKERVVSDCIKRLKSEKMRSKRQDLHEQIKTAQDSGDQEILHKLMHEFHYLIKKDEIK